MKSYITGYGSALPRRVVTNAELAPMLGVDPGWIEAGSGIRERRWVEADQSCSDLAATAVSEALKDARVSADCVDYLIGCTLSPDYQVPGIAPLVQRRLDGFGQIPAIDLRAGCAGILYSLQMARGLIESRAANRVVCFGAEAQSKGLDLRPQSAELSMLFGDGAGALVVSREAQTAAHYFTLSIDDVLILTDGNFAEDLVVKAPGTANGARWFDPAQATSDLYRPSMNGRNVILHAVRKLAEAAAQIIARNEISMDQIDLIVPHQANANLLRSLGKKLNFSEDRIVVNVDRFGNTSGASAFLALWQASRERKLRPGNRVLLLAFGAGFTWGAAICTVCDAGRDA